MASIAKRPNGQWRARYRDDSRREHSKHFARKVDAQRWLDEVTASVVTGQYVDPKAGKVTVREYAEAWRVGQVHRPTTRAHVETMLRLHVYPAFGDRPLAAVLPSQVQAWVTKLTATLQPPTVGVAHSILASMFKAAVRDRKIASSPCDATRLPKIERRQIVPLATASVQLLAEQVQPRYRALVILAAGTGLRQGECLGLTIDRIDFLRRTLTVDRQLTTLPGGPPFLAPPKTAASVRTIPLPQVVVDELAAHLVSFPANVDGFMFTTAAGLPINRTTFSTKTWRPTVKATELPEGTRFHDLRQFFASLLIRHGESVKTVQARLGHASAAETLDTYSHLWPDNDDRTREAVDAVLGSPADSLRTREEA